MAKSHKVLLVDDDRTWQVYIFTALQEDFLLSSAYDGKHIISLVEQEKPDCILLDVTLPDTTGFDICSQLKAQPEIAAIPVIFLSSRNSMQEKIRGFELGAEDYLVKSPESDLLKAKIHRAIEQYTERRSLDEKVSAAQIVAFEALSSSADLGRCLRYVERTYSMSSFENVAAGLFQTMSEFGLRASLMFMTPEGPLFFSQGSQDLSPLEKEMFIASHKEGRFVDYGYRTFCNFNLVSMLIKNMPLEEPERYGRIKDTIPWLLGATDGKVRDLNNDASLANEIELIQTAGDNLSYQFEQARKFISSDQTDLIKAMEEMHKLIDQLQALGVDLVKKLKLGVEENNQKELGNNEIYSSDVDLF